MKRDWNVSAYAPGSVIGVHVSQCGFDPYERDDGMRVSRTPSFHHAYDRYLRDRGYGGDSPWHEWANAAEGDDGKIASGWLNENAVKPARVAEEDSETPYMTRRAMEFMREAKGDTRPWCLHLSYIKPHWPYIVPAPYHKMYGPEHMLPVDRNVSELENPHPVYRAFAEERFSKLFSEQHKREAVISAYMGLIKQIDDQLGVLFSFMRDEGLIDNTLIVFTSDHGDYLGDHWLGEKYLFHEPSVRVPMIIRDPSPAADRTRGTVDGRLVEMVDLAPTFLDFFGGTPKPHILEGKSLLPLLHGELPQNWRQYAFSEFDYAFELARVKLDVPVVDARLFMVTDGRWKYIHAEGFRPLLFDMQTDPHELRDVGGAAETAEIRISMERELGRWMRRAQMRITSDEASITESDEAFKHYDVLLHPHVLIGYWDEAELAAEREKLKWFQKNKSRLP